MAKSPLWVGAKPPTPLFTAADLHKSGDAYGGWRLPEDQVAIRDEEGQEHQLHIIGRYLQCSVHQDDSVAALVGFTPQKKACEAISAAWNHSFRPGSEHISFFPADKIQEPGTRFLDPNPILQDHRLLAMQRRVQATILKRIRTQTPIDISALNACLGHYPEFWSNPDWLQDYPSAGVFPDDWAVMLKLDMAKELTPLALIERPWSFALTSLISNQHHFENESADKVFWQHATLFAQRVFALRRKINPGLVEVLQPEDGIEQLAANYKTEAKAKKQLRAAGAFISPHLHPWVEQGIADIYQARLADSFTQVAPELTPAEIAHFAYQWRQHDQPQNILKNLQLAKWAIAYQQAGWGYSQMTTPPPHPLPICPIPVDEDINLAETLEELAFPPDWIADLTSQEEINIGL